MKSILIIFSIIAVSCNSFNNNVKVKNFSETVVDSVIFTGNPKCNSLKFIKILPSTKISKQLINCNELSNDGSYIIHIFKDNKKYKKSFGYFTNGDPIFKEICITINKNNRIEVIEN